jgi:hypothetical protein
MLYEYGKIDATFSAVVPAKAGTHIPEAAV